MLIEYDINDAKAAPDMLKIGINKILSKTFTITLINPASIWNFTILSALNSEASIFPNPLTTIAGAKIRTGKYDGE